MLHFFYVSSLSFPTAMEDGTFQWSHEMCLEYMWSLPSESASRDTVDRAVCGGGAGEGIAAVDPRPRTGPIAVRGSPGGSRRRQRGKDRESAGKMVMAPQEAELVRH